MARAAREMLGTRAEAQLALFDCIEVYYNRHLRHLKLGYMIPAESEGSLN